jgi:hypothetical protein
VRKAAAVSKGGNGFGACYVYTINRNVTLEAAMAPSVLSNREAVLTTIISATADCRNELSLTTTSTLVENRKHTEKERHRSGSKSFSHTVISIIICSDIHTSNGKRVLYQEVQCSEYCEKCEGYPLWQESQIFLASP